MSGLAVRRLCRRLVVLCLGVLLVYVAFAALASVFPDVEQQEGARFWPAFLPDWPVTLLLSLAAIFVVADVLLWGVAASAARSERRRLQALAWPSRADAKMAIAKGVQDLKLTAFRAEPVPGGARLTWTAPAGTYDRVLVLRSRESFALSPQTAKHQSVAYEGEETGFIDQGLIGERVYFYTAFAEARGAGQWSPPVWASATTPKRRLRDVPLRDLWMLRG